MKLKQLLTISSIFVGLSFATNWKADTANSKIDFTVKGIFGTVHGSFTGLQASIQFSEKDLNSSSMTASIDAKSVSTGISLRNSDLRNKEEWLNTDKYPRINFKSTQFEKTAEGFKVHGELTIKGITKPVEIPFTFSDKDGSGVFKGQFTIPRLEFNLGSPGGTVGEIVTVMLTVPAKSTGS
jgi:polyisoprenoid-binding protein YceI